ncbi:unnamed protein product [Bursaphelenchus okinawaensis]|uniref:Microtubule binding protein n=1 Tax=Bursaphelenchus okinawaensis TaxID=465554 RepID=A0A811JS83_9BILA|nr:unnamed protein product [Bursaphelenchus okinawaensis]CAG9080539.1 unnamed protein product [Bursaphelenchus okinawaensis]
MSLKDQYTVTNVWISAVTPDNISRMSLLSWVNDCLQSQLNKIEEMSTGAAYCQLTDRLFPGSVPLKKVKWNSRNEVDWINNWRILQKTWTEIGIDKPVNVQTLMRAKFQDNFEFAQWFKKFYDANDSQYEYDPLAARGGEQFPVNSRPGARAPPSRAAAPPVRRAPVASQPVPRPASKPATAAAARPATTSARTTRTPVSGGVDAKAKSAYETEISELKNQLEVYEKEVTDLSGERDFYYNRLREVEELCQQIGEANNVEVSRILNILYTKDDGEVSGGEFEQVEHEIVDQNGSQSNVTETLDRSESAQALNDTHEINGTHEGPPQEQPNETVGEFESAVGVEDLHLDDSPTKAADTPREKVKPEAETAVKANGDIAQPEEF